jgi:hypothetical protein
MESIIYTQAQMKALMQKHLDATLVGAPVVDKVEILAPWSSENQTNEPKLIVRFVVKE